MERKKDHPFQVLMLPWLAHGHITPFLEVAKRLTKRNFFVYFCSTPSNVCSIKEQINQQVYPNIQLVELHLPQLPNLPPQLHTTKLLPTHLIPTLIEAFDAAKPAFYNILKLLNPDLVIYDFIQPWVPSVASSLNIPAIYFLVVSATSVCFMWHYLVNPNAEFPFPAIYHNEHEAPEHAKLGEKNVNGITLPDRLVRCANQSSKFIAVKSFREIEGKYFDYLSRLTGKEIIPLGPLAQEFSQQDRGCKFITWLSKKDKSSTVFVSFGSEHFMSQEEIEEIAHGLEESKINFIWVIRFPEGKKLNVEDVLPSGYLEKIGARGLAVEGWAPQTQILGHPSIGGFVTHCGWGSVMEAMGFGVPLIALPLKLEQPLNSRLVVELGVGLEVKREKNGNFERKGLASAIREVVVGNEGEEVRRKAKEMGEVIGKKGDEEIEVMAEKLLELCGKSNKTVTTCL